MARDVPPESPGLAVGELRWFPAVAAVVRVLELREHDAVVEALPHGRPVVLRALRELREAAVVAPRGFRAGYALGALDVAEAEPQQLLEALLADERARGRENLRRRAIDEYLAPVVAGDAARDRLYAQLEGGPWKQVGKGSERGWVPADEEVDWRARWRRDGLPLPAASVEDEDAAIAQLQDDLTACAPRELGQVATCAWLPHPLRDAAAARLAEAWIADVSADLRPVSDDALVRVLPRLSDELGEPALRALAASPTVSNRVRGEIVAAWRDRAGAEDLRDLLTGVRAPTLRVAVELLRLCTTREEREAALALVFRLPPPDDDDDAREALAQLRREVDAMGLGAWSACRAAAATVLAKGARPTQVERWLERIGPDLADLLGALATVRRLRGDHGPLAPLAMPWDAVQSGLSRWMDHEAGDAPEPELSGDVGSAAWLLSVERYVEARTHRLDARGPGAKLEALAREVVATREELERLRVQVDDVDNARRVLGRAETRLAEAELADLRRGARAEIEGERRRERQQIAHLISEVVTAIERIHEATGGAGLDTLSRRVRELASAVGMSVVGRVGEHVTIEHTAHQASGPAGALGEIRRVGVVDGEEEVLVKPAVVSIRD